MKHIANYRALFLQHLAQTSPAPLMLEIERAEGIYLYDTDGKKYIDLISGIAVSNVGHGHPAVVKAICEQAQKYLHTMVYGEYVQAPQVCFAQALTSTLPPALNTVYFTNSGAEAVEGAMKLAKRYTGRYEIIAVKNAYHGSTHGALSLQSSETYKRAFRPLLPFVKYINIESQSDLEKITQKTAAIIIEPVRAECGIQIPSKTWMQQLRKRCTETGTLLIFDEIQTGMGRTGTWWALEHYEVAPDILLSAKSLGGGLPLGAFIAPQEIMHTLSHDPILGHITTFGGHPLSCAAGLAAFHIIKEVLPEVEAKGQLIEDLLSNNPHIREIRRKGLMMAVDIGSWEKLQKTIQHALQSGIIVDWFLFNNQSIRIAPPLTITEEEIKEAGYLLNQAIYRAFK
ncbi:acetylornithine/succinyldiaminopimelate/putrescine aminotransferase [Thermonema lapsum]|uniref:Acetylornithine/succinyldiaminopimelate/putresci ne aminotransferase n=1 Tax=Thermonema lapsum TaxID=28195 RepID=A0A846MMS8_9BACT|nr:aspartate aminotransferase family protein [Thermonema lapsum]NIK72858.1 acetylornithine/succinyldiaminopimelate/putrescine aminotransferase [Thermonema lapsum]